MAKVEPIEGEIWKVAELDSKGTDMVSNMGRIIGPSGKLLNQWCDWRFRILRGIVHPPALSYQDKP